MSIYDFSVSTITGEGTTIGAYKGSVLLIVNVASKCGLTPQYTGLEALYQKYKDKGLAILGFPCNQFGAQEPGTEAEIQTFCSTNYSVTFPMFSKIDVNGATTHPLDQFLKSEQKDEKGEEAIEWNFTKFLVDAEGNVLRRYAPMTTPEAIDADLAGILG